MATNIVLPNQWEPRMHQIPFWRYMAGGGLRAVAVWHRRAGKDSTALNFTCTAAHKRIGTYWHMLPQAEHARKAVWDYIDKQGRRTINQAFPLDLRARTLEQEMKIEFKIGSIWQLCGSDNYNSLVGANPVGVVFSEYSLADPEAWNYIRPILAENGGWAVFLYTPRGKNHGHELFEMAKANPEWFAEMLTVDDTLVIPPEVIASERASGMTDDMVEQEYFCSFEGVRQGSIYGEYMRKMRLEGRLGKVPYDRQYPVNTFWDIGHGDAAAVIAHQQVGAQDRFLRAFEASGQDMPFFYAKLLEWSQEHGYLYGQHYLPHDAKNVTMSSKSNPLGKNIWDQAVTLGMQNLKLVPRISDKWTGILLTRSKFGTVYMDEEGCKPLVNALNSYHKEYDEARRCYSDQPYHDWSSNLSDAFRQWAQGFVPAGQAGVFTLPQATVRPQVSRGYRPVVKTVGSRRAGY